MTLILAQIPGWLISLLAVIFLVICLALVLIVLIQRPQGGGLSGAFGAGGGAGQTAFGTKTGDVLTWVTIGMFVLFLGLAIGLNFAVRPPKAPSGEPRAVSPQQAETDAATERVMREMGTAPESPDTPGGLIETDPDAELPGEPIQPGDPSDLTDPEDQPEPTELPDPAPAPAEPPAGGN